MLAGKKIILGVCGSIAAYKAALFLRLLKKEGAEVRVVFTSSASSFIAPLTFEALSGNEVLSDFVVKKDQGWNNHIHLALWADLIVIAPATATTLSRCANGLSDNFLTAVYLSARCPILFAPAMDLDMYTHSAVKNNIDKLRSYGNYILEAGFGELASGLTGAGRMQEPEQILSYIRDFFKISGNFAGKKVLITAGPTYEPIDPVRYIGNRSSGKMGFALAEEFRNRGAEVTMISGPVSLPEPTGIKLIKIEQAQEMYEHCIEIFPSCDIAVLAAAVADFKPTLAAAQKIKKETADTSILLEKTQDIARELGKMKKEQQMLVGFALETENEMENARRKLENKNFNLLVLNSLNDKGAGFAHDTNKITLMFKDNKTRFFELKSKKEVAMDIVECIGELLS